MSAPVSLSVRVEQVGDEWLAKGRTETGSRVLGLRATAASREAVLHAIADIVEALAVDFEREAGNGG